MSLAAAEQIGRAVGAAIVDAKNIRSKLLDFAENLLDVAQLIKDRYGDRYPSKQTSRAMVDSREGLTGRTGNLDGDTCMDCRCNANGSYSSAVYYRVGLIIALLAIAGCGSESPLLPQESYRPRGVDLYVAGVQAYQAGDHKLAQDRFEQATQVNPSLEMARSMLGDIYRSSRAITGAGAGDLERRVLLDPYTPDNFYRLGVTYQFLQRAF